MDVGRLPDVEPIGKRLQPVVIVDVGADDGARLGDRRQPAGPRPVGGDHAHQRMARLVQVVGHLHRQRAALGEIVHQPGKQHFVLAQPLQRRIGEDQVGRLARPPFGDVRLIEGHAGQAAARLGQHRLGIGDGDDFRLREAIHQHARAGAGAAAEIDDSLRREVDPGEQVARRLGALGPELEVERGVPFGRQPRCRLRVRDARRLRHQRIPLVCPPAAGRLPTNLSALMAG